MGESVEGRLRQAGHAIQPLPTCVTLGWFLGISVPQFSQGRMWMNHHPFLRAVARIGLYTMYGVLHSQPDTQYLMGYLHGSNHYVPDYTVIPSC